MKKIQNQIIVEAIIDEAIGPFYVHYEVGIFDSERLLPLENLKHLNQIFL